MRINSFVCIYVSAFKFHRVGRPREYDDYYAVNLSFLTFEQSYQSTSMFFNLRGARLNLEILRAFGPPLDFPIALMSINAFLIAPQFQAFFFAK